MRCLVNLLDMTPASLLIPRSSQILTHVTAALSAGPVSVQEGCINAIMSLAESIRGEQLATYYDSIMPFLKQVLDHARSKGLDTLWGLALECLALVGESSGKDKFSSDAVEMMNSLVTLQNSLSEDSEARRPLMKAWVRIARCLGAEFLPYMQLVMQKLLIAIGQDVTAGTGDIDLDDLDNRDDIDLLETDDGGWIAVRTAAVEEQVDACQLLILLVERLQEHFYPYVEQTVRTIAPLLRSPHEGKLYIII